MAETKKWDTAEFLKTEEDIAAYLEAALDEGDLTFMLKALGNVARSHGMTDISARTGYGRESLYKALSESGNPSFATVWKVLDAMGLRLSIQIRRLPAETTTAARL